jgi:hypothetical protein
VAVLEWQGWIHEIRSGQRGVDRCSQDRMQKYPADLALGPEQRLRPMLQRQRRINQSITFMLTTYALAVVTNVRTHEDKNTVSILLPATRYFLIFILCNLSVHIKERP